jgi:hypothetical protein
MHGLTLSHKKQQTREEFRAIGQLQSIKFCRIEAIEMFGARN